MKRPNERPLHPAEQAPADTPHEMYRKHYYVGSPNIKAGTLLTSEMIAPIPAAKPFCWHDLPKPDASVTGTIEAVVNGVSVRTPDMRILNSVAGNDVLVKVSEIDLALLTGRTPRKKSALWIFTKKMLRVAAIIQVRLLPFTVAACFAAFTDLWPPMCEGESRAGGWALFALLTSLPWLLSLTLVPDWLRETWQQAKREAKR